MASATNFSLEARVSDAFRDPFFQFLSRFGDPRGTPKIDPEGVMGSILGSKRGPKTRFSADSLKNAFRTYFSTIFASKNESKTQAFYEQPYAGKSCKARSAAKCGCAESYVKYSVRGLCGKTPKIEAATEESQKSTKKRPKNGAKKRREKQDRRDPKKHPK